MFADIFEVLAAAMRWEEKATEILAQEAEMSEFEDAIRFLVLYLLLLLNCLLCLLVSIIILGFFGFFFFVWLY